MRRLKRVAAVLLQILLDCAAAALSVYAGLSLYFGYETEAFRDTFHKIGQAPGVYVLLLVFYLAVAIVSNAIFGCYRNIWKHAGIGEFLRQIGSSVLLAGILFAVNFNMALGLPAELVLIVSILELLFMVAVRMAVPFFVWVRARVSAVRRREAMTRVLIFGAGDAGTTLLRRLSDPQENRRVVGFIDDDKSLWGRSVSGGAVLGGREKLAEAISSLGVQEVIVAIPTVERDTLKEVLNCCHPRHCRLLRFGSLDTVSEESLLRAPITDLNLEDLLRRDSVQLDMEAVKGFIEGRVVLVTGGAGSIGSEICRQVLAFGAARLLIFDICENGLYEINNELSRGFGRERYELLLGSIRDKRRLREVMDRWQPEVVFHAAAHKHVPMMELNPAEAVKNNLFGTINVAQEAIAHGVKKFILISTDKAVNPTNIMGASKRMAELAIQTLDRTGATEFAAVRFGNVLGSSGSVVPLFKKQIADGGPVTVTHREMRRYFMTIPEAVQLVLEAGAMARGGEIFVLDMGDPVYIYDLACDMIRLSGLEPERDIEIKITGIRPGEKLFEEISLRDERADKTRNNKIYIMKPTELDRGQMLHQLARLDECIASCDLPGMFETVREFVPTFSAHGAPENTPAAVSDKPGDDLAAARQGAPEADARLS